MSASTSNIVPCRKCSKTKHSFDLTGVTDTPNGWTRSYQSIAKDYGFYFHSDNGSLKDPIHGGSRTTAGKFGASASAFPKFLDANHYGVKLSPEERHRIDLWLDTNSVFYGTYENTRVQSLGKDVRPSYRRAFFFSCRTRSPTAASFAKNGTTRPFARTQHGANRAKFTKKQQIPPHHKDVSM